MTASNVLFITVDQWRGDCLSAAGHPVVRTPNLDRLAADCRAGSPRFQVVAANLLAPVIADLADDLVDVVAAGGSIVVSGLLADRWPTGVGPLVAANRMGVEAVDEEAGWVAVTLRRHPDPVGLHPVPTLP